MRLSIAPQVLEGWVAEILRANGASDEAAAATANCLIDADRRGVDTHGVAQLRQYLPRLRRGAIDGAATPETVVDLAGLAVIDGRNALGPYVMAHGTDVACAKAGAAGASVVLIRNSNHFGAASCYAERAARRGCFAIVVSNSDPGLAPMGATAPLLGTNPIALASPAGEEPSPPSLDIAASVAAVGKVRAALRRGERLPAGWAIDRNGEPTEDPQEALGGTMLPMGGHKGFGLAFMIDVLVGAVAGANVSPLIASDLGSPERQRVGHAIVAIHVDAARPVGDYARDLAGLVGFVHEAPRVASAPPFQIPGEREAEAALRSGAAVTLDATVVAALEQLGSEYGCPFPAPHAHA